MGKKPHMHLVENYEQPPRTSQNSVYQSHFLVLKNGLIFQKRIVKNIGLGDQLLSFNKKMFLKYFIF